LGLLLGSAFAGLVHNALDAGIGGQVGVRAKRFSAQELCREEEVLHSADGVQNDSERRTRTKSGREILLAKGALRKTAGAEKRNLHLPREGGYGMTRAGREAW
jgi:hypothetical protein